MPFRSTVRTSLRFLAIAFLPVICLAEDSKNFYQANKSLSDAMTFIGLAPDRLDTYKGSVTGTLPAGAERTLADRLIKIDSEKNVPLFLELIGQKSVETLKSHVGNDAMVDRVVGSIKDGAYLGIPPGSRFFATYTAVSGADRSRYQGGQGMKFDPLPSGTITFYYFHLARNRLIGTRFEVHKSGEAFKLILPTFVARQ